MKQSELEERAEWILNHLGPGQMAGPAVRQFRPLNKERRYTLDLAYPRWKLGIELQGGIWSRRRDAKGKRLGSAHTGVGHERDMEKLNVLQIAGWLVLQFSTKMVEENPTGVARTVCAALIARARRGGAVVYAVGSGASVGPAGARQGKPQGRSRSPQAAARDAAGGKSAAQGGG